MMNVVTRPLRAGVVLFAACVAVRAQAGVRFDFVAQASGYSYAGRMSIQGTKTRVDISSGAHPMFNKNLSFISRNAGTEVLVLDHARRSYFQRQVGHIGGPLATARGLGRTRTSGHRVTKTKEALTNGPATERHTIRADYSLVMDVAGEQLDATVWMEAQFDIDPQIKQRAHPWGLQYAAKTGFDKIDDAIAARVPDRLPLRQFVSVSRQFAGGPIMTETLTLTVTNVVEEEIDDLEFYPPAGYPYDEPVFSFGQ